MSDLINELEKFFEGYTITYKEWDDEITFEKDGKKLIIESSGPEPALYINFE